MTYFETRKFHYSDLPRLYDICLKTGLMGSDASHLYQDKELLGHLYVAPYAVKEPALCTIVTGNGMPLGYVCGTADSIVFEKECQENWYPVLKDRYPQAHTDDNRMDAIISRLFYQSTLLPNIDLTLYPAHLHINLLPEAQGKGLGGKCLNIALQILIKKGVTGVYLTVFIENQRAIRFYQKFGFSEVSRNPYALVLARTLN